jgi:hypothetical protein
MLVVKGMLNVNFTIRMVWYGIKLFPNEVVVQVTNVWKPSHWIGETTCPTLERLMFYLKFPFFLEKVIEFCMEID